MAKKRVRSGVRDPIQVYLTAAEREELDRLASVHRISRAEVLRRGIRSFGLESAAGKSPVLDLMSELKGNDWPADLASGHDSHLADAYRRKSGEEE
jgi:hypothetical protein